MNKKTETIARIVFQDGVYCPERSSMAAVMDGVSITPDGTTLCLSEDMPSLRAIQIYYWNKVPGTRTTKLRITVGAYVNATVFVAHQGDPELEYTHEVTTNIDLGKAAHLQYYQCQRESLLATHTHQFTAELSEDSYLGTYHIAQGGALATDQLRYRLNGNQATCESLGFFQANDTQTIRIDSQIQHACSHTHSRQFYKGIANDRARGGFVGNVTVDPSIEDIGAFQKNNNLLLSPHASIDTRPELEIYSDDVRCSHGATVGQLDANALFYLRSRGLTEADAKRLLVNGFVQEILSAFPEHVALTAFLREGGWTSQCASEKQKTSVTT